MNQAAAAPNADKNAPTKTPDPIKTPPVQAKTPEPTKPAPIATPKSKDSNVVDIAQLEKEEAELHAKLKALSEKKAEAVQAQAESVYAEIRESITKFGAHFTREQKKTIATLLGLKEKTAKTGSTSTATTPVVQKYRLPTGETWSGRGRKPTAFLSWLETVNGKEHTKKFEEKKVPAMFPLNNFE